MSVTMGTYLIAGARSLKEAVDFVDAPEGCQWTLTPEGITFEAPAMTDAEAEALYEGFVPSGVTDETYESPIPDVVRNAALRLKARADAGDPVARDCLILFRFVNRRLNGS